MDAQAADGAAMDLMDIKPLDYQRDSDQWDETTKLLLIESVINDLSIPAFFFEVAVGRRHG